VDQTKKRKTKHELIKEKFKRVRKVGNRGAPDPRKAYQRRGGLIPTGRQLL